MKAEKLVDYSADEMEIWSVDRTVVKLASKPAGMLAEMKGGSWAENLVYDTVAVMVWKTVCDGAAE